VTAPAHVQRLLNLLERVSESQGGWRARCPAHEDKNPSLSIDMGDDGRILVTCHAGCELPSIAKAIGLELRDFFAPSATASAGTRTSGKSPRDFATLEDAIAAACPRAHRFVTSWQYKSAGGESVFHVCRFEPTKPPANGEKPEKTFRPISHVDNGFVIEDPPGPLPLYRLPELLALPNATVYICEGEKAADALAALGLVATTTAHGAKSPKKTDLSPLCARDVVILPDNDDSGVSYANRFSELLSSLSHSPTIRILRLPDLPLHGDAVEFVADRRAKGKNDTEIRAEIEERAAGVSVVPRPPGASHQDLPSRDSDLPRIIVTNRPLRDIVDDAASAISAKNDPPFLFQQAMALVRVCTDERGRPVIQRMELARIVEALTRTADYFKITGKNAVHVPPPQVVANTLLALTKWPFPPLVGITEIPVLRPSGTILDATGYDPETRLLYLPAKGLVVPPIQVAPTSADVEGAVALILELLVDFPFSDKASHTNAIALLLTPMLRPAIDGCVPLALVDSPRMGTGKSLLISVTAVVNTGRAAAVMSVPETEEEWRKQLTSGLLAGATFIAIDNVEGTLRSPSLARFLTCDVWWDRLLGGNEKPELPQRTTCSATGNNIQVLGDLRRRVYRIRLDAQEAKPWTRSGFRHPELISWVGAHRGQLLAALLTIAQAWFMAGKPEAPRAKFGGFDSWARVVGGVLAHAGIDGFLSNQDEFFEQTSDEDAEWEAFLSAWREDFGPQPITVAQLVERIQASDKLRGSLPGFLAEYVIAAPGRSLSRRLGRALVTHCDARFGEQGLHLRRAGKDTHAKTNCWRVLTKGEAQHDGL
jgi:hypothetical protein